MLRRFLQRLQEGVEGLIGQHVHLIDEVHLEAATGGRVLNVVRQFPHVVHPGTGGRINLDQVDKPAFLNFLATGAFTTRSRRDTGLTIQASGQQAADGGFTHATGTSEEVSMVKTLIFQGVNQCLKHVLLTNHVLKCTGAPFTGKYLVAHVLPTAVKMALTLAWT